MDLGFTKVFKNDVPVIGGKETNFVNKIWAGLIKIEGKNYFGVIYDYMRYTKPVALSNFIGLHPKRHTMRWDKTRRWKVGMKIHFVTGSRTKYRHQFAPLLTVTGIQEVRIIHGNNGVGFTRYVFIDEQLLNDQELKALARNDGFDSVSDFFAYFNTDFEGVLIHWTDLKY